MKKIFTLLASVTARSITLKWSLVQIKQLKIKVLVNLPAQEEKAKRHWKIAITLVIILLFPWIQRRRWNNKEKILEENRIIIIIFKAIMMIRLAELKPKMWIYTESNNNNLNFHKDSTLQHALNVNLPLIECQLKDKIRETMMEYILMCIEVHRAQMDERNLKIRIGYGWNNERI